MACLLFALLLYLELPPVHLIVLPGQAGNRFALSTDVGIKADVGGNVQP